MIYATLEVRHQQTLRFEKRIREFENELGRKENALADTEGMKKEI